jgi:hypothetical protein
MPDEDKLSALRDEFVRMQRLQGYNPQARGRRLNGFIADLLSCWGIKSRANERSIGEIDVAFTIGDVRYILEAKWEKSKADTGELSKLQRRVRQRLSGTYGIFLSMAGYSPDALSEVSLGERLEVLLLDAEHLEALLAGRISPQQLLTLVRDSAAFHGRAFTPMSQVAAMEGFEPDQVGRFDYMEPSRSAGGPQYADSPLQDNPSIPWNPVRSDRGNPKGGYVAFTGHQGAYALVTLLLGILVFPLIFLVLDSGSLGKIVASGCIVLCVFLMIGFGSMARVPIRLEVGVNGMQVFGRRETTWIPWEIVDRVDVVRVTGNPHLVAWSRYADRFPDTDNRNGGPRFVPGLGAMAVCPLNVLRAKRHEVVRALDRYAGNRI